MSKAMWIEAWDGARNEALDMGATEEEADAYACREAQGRARERLADRIDHARLLKKEGNL